MNRKITKKSTIATIISAVFFMMTVQVSFADSFINDSTIQALKNFKLGGAESTEKEDVSNNKNIAKIWGKGDSFVNDSILKQLENFKFGEPRETVNNNENMPLFWEKGDSFITASTIKQLEIFRFGSVDKPRIRLAVPSGI